MSKLDKNWMKRGGNIDNYQGKISLSVLLIFYQYITYIHGDGKTPKDNIE